VHFDRYGREALRVARIEDFRFRDLRHTCASYLASQRASLLEIGNVLGHRSIQSDPATALSSRFSMRGSGRNHMMGTIT